MPFEILETLAWAAAVGLAGFSLPAPHCRVSGAGAVERGDWNRGRGTLPWLRCSDCLGGLHLLARLLQGHSPP